ncbi:unnamed protein product [Caenorhabditis sp. 36 PRJEB53466]|nr:unnamed protein product [Caenorhabditis sp. 36 PRJEB53466]
MMMEPEKSFILSHTVKNVASLTTDFGPVETHCDIPWKLEASQREDCLALYLYCLIDNPSNMWNISVVFKFKLKSKAGEEIEEGDEDPSKYTRDLTSWGYCDVIKWPRLVEEFVVDNQLTFECHVTIKDIVGINRKRKMEWEAPEERMTDVVVIVGEEKKTFHVQKGTLANFSPVFKAMFTNPKYREFREKEVVLGDVDPNVFEVLINYIHRCDTDITDENVEKLLALADRFDVNVMLKKCEKYLMKKSELEIEKRLELAEAYKLVNLHGNCLESLRTARQIADVCHNVDEMGERTSKALLKKMSDIIRKSKIFI